MPISSLETITLTYLVYSQSPMHLRLVPGRTHVSVRPPAGSGYKSLKRWFEQMLVDLHAS